MSQLTHFQNHYDLLIEFSDNAYNDYLKYGINKEQGYAGLCVAGAYDTSARSVEWLALAAGVMLEKRESKYNEAAKRNNPEIYEDDAQGDKNELHDLQMERKYERA